MANLTEIMLSFLAKESSKYTVNLRLQVIAYNVIKHFQKVIEAS